METTAKISHSVKDFVLEEVTSKKRTQIWSRRNGVEMAGWQAQMVQRWLGGSRPGTLGKTNGHCKETYGLATIRTKGSWREGAKGNRGHRRSMACLDV